MNLAMTKDLFIFPSFGRGIFHVWMRNFLYFRYSLSASLFWVVLEPVLYLIAIGFGLGKMVKSVDGVGYSDFYFPALMASSGMMISFFEGAYASYTKFHHQKTYSTILLTPISPQEIILGEILWSATKGFLSVIGVLLVGAALGMVHSPAVLISLCILWILCWVFAAFGMLLTSIARNYDSFVYAQSCVVIPLALFSGTYFPLSQLPTWFQSITMLFPLSHAVMASRQLHFGVIQADLFIHVMVIFLYAVLLTNISVQRMERKLYY